LTAHPAHPSPRADARVTGHAPGLTPP
jgi:hypothetical protein